MFHRALRLAAIPTLIALFVTPTRFFLERAGLPESVIFIVGLLWLTLVVVVFWGIKLADEERPYVLFFSGLAIFALLSRIPVLALWWITKTWELGTHYDIFENWGQAVVGQLVLGPIVQIIPGGLLGSLTLAIKRRHTHEENSTDAYR